MRNSTRTRRGVAATNLLIRLVLLAAVAVAIIAVVTRDPRGRRSSGSGAGQRYSEALRELGEVDPSLIGWRESASPYALDMDEPVGMAVDGRDRIYVIGERLLVLDASGSELLRSEELEQDYRALTVDAQGRIYAARKRGVDTLSIDAGEPQLLRSVEIEEEVTSLASIVLAFGSVFVADATGTRVLKLPFEVRRPDAREDPLWKVFAKGFMVPSVMDIAVTHDGDLLTVDPGRQKVQVRDFYGDVIRSFGEMGEKIEDFHGCCNPAAVAVMSDGRTVTAEKGFPVTRVKVYGLDGKLESVVAAPDSFDERPNGPPIILDVAVDSNGRILVLDPSRKQVRVFTPKEDER